MLWLQPTQRPGQSPRQRANGSCEKRRSCSRTARYQAARRLRPLARRLLITCLPPLVAIRARKPWLRFRFNTLGWNVLFIAMFPKRLVQSAWVHWHQTEGRLGMRYRRPKQLRQKGVYFREMAMSFQRDDAVYFAVRRGGHGGDCGRWPVRSMNL